MALLLIESAFAPESSAMGGRGDRLARGIQAFVENPVTNLVKGVILLLIGLSDVSHTLRDELAHGHLRVGHGLIIIGLCSILGALPHLMDGIGAAAQYIELRDGKGRANHGRGDSGTGRP